MRAAALVKSGTSTLQAALAGTPLVVTYRVHPATFFMAQHSCACRMWAWSTSLRASGSRPNCSRRRITRRHLLADALLPLLDADSATRRQALGGLARVRKALEPARPTRTAADRVADLAGSCWRA
jgi:lipid-A-disaccharide synthase